VRVLVVFWPCTAAFLILRQDPHSAHMLSFANHALFRASIFPLSEQNNASCGSGFAFGQTQIVGVQREAQNLL